MAETEELSGTYELLGFEQTGPDGIALKSSPESWGLLIYTLSGAMSVSMYRVLANGSDEVQRNWVKDLYYAGSYSVEGSEVIHHIKVGFPSSFRNTDQRRAFEWDPVNRVLVLKVLSNEKKVIAEISWKKLASA